MRARALALTAGALGATLGIGAVMGPLSCADDEQPQEGAAGAGGMTFVLDGGGGLDPDATCALYEEQAVEKKVNLYIMFDKSSSMAGDTWTSAKAGLEAFVTDDYSAGLGVALRFFPRDPDSTPVCDQHAYKQPTVPFGELPSNATALMTAMNAEVPDGFGTPMYPALGGAILKGIEVAEQNPEQVSAVLLITDGQPQGPADSCGGIDPEDPDEIAALAAIGLGYDPPVTTFVVGLPGVNQTIAHQIAEAGGTDSAILVGANNVEDEFRQALLKVRGEAVPCEYAVPEQVLLGEVAITEVNIEVTSGEPGAEPELVPQDQSCQGDGWYYDDPDDPSLILLCPETCAALKADLGASIRVLLGCQTVIR